MDHEGPSSSRVYGNEVIKTPTCRFGRLLALLVGSHALLGEVELINVHRPSGPDIPCGRKKAVTDPRLSYYDSVKDSYTTST